MTTTTKTLIAKKKVAKKKVAKKVKKTVNKTSALSKIQEKAENFIKHDQTIILLDSLEYIKSFEVNDIVKFRHCEWREGFKSGKYYFNGEPTEVDLRYKVVYVDSRGFPHISVIREDGSIADFAINVLEQLNNYVYDVSDFNVRNLIEHDPDFIDAAILQDGSYDPLATYKEELAKKELEFIEKVTKHFQLKEHNSKLKIYTGSKRGRNAFFKNYNVGDSVYSYNYGNMVVKIKQDDIIVFNTDEGLVSFTKEKLGVITLFSKEPEKLPYIGDIPKDIYHKYKPKKK